MRCHLYLALEDFSESITQCLIKSKIVFNSEINGKNSKNCLVMKVKVTPYINSGLQKQILKSKSHFNTFTIHSIDYSPLHLLIINLIMIKLNLKT